MEDDAARRKPGSAIVPAGAESRGKALAERAVDEALGDRVAPETKRALTKELAPWAEKLVKVLDEAIRIPGTDIHIGLDPILGLLLPGAGDVITGGGSIALLFLALKERVPTVALLRMLLNVLLDAIVGAIPILGDAFDVFFRANRRNLDIIERYRDEPHAEPTWRDYAIVYGAVGVVVCGIVLPPIFLWGFFYSLFSALFGDGAR